MSGAGTLSLCMLPSNTHRHTASDDWWENYCWIMEKIAGGWENVLQPSSPRASWLGHRVKRKTSITFRIAWQAVLSLSRPTHSHSFLILLRRLAKNLRIEFANCSAEKHVLALGSPTPSQSINTSMSHSIQVSLGWILKRSCLDWSCASVSSE